MVRFDQAMADFRSDKFRRLTLAALLGVMLAHLLPMESTVFVGMFPASMILSMDRFSLRDTAWRCVVLLLGLVAGTLVLEWFQNAPILAALTTFGVFVGILKLFATGTAIGPTYNFGFSYVLATVNGSYPESTMELSVTQYYPIQLTLVFVIIWGCFALFPAVRPRVACRTPVSREFAVPDYELVIYGLVWLAVWLFFLCFEWRFALFAFLSMMGAFRNFERTVMKRIAVENIVVHVTCCSVAALFSLLLFGMAGNGWLLAVGVLLVVCPFTYLAVYPPTPALAYRHNTMISGILIPLILYLSTEHAAVYQSALRAGLIVFLMVILWLVIEYLYHGVTVMKEVRDLPVRRPLRKTWLFARRRVKKGSRIVHHQLSGATHFRHLSPSDGLSEPQTDPVSSGGRVLPLSTDDQREAGHHPE